MRLIGRLIGLVLVVIIVFGVSLFFLPGEKIARIAEDQIRAQTGREVRIGEGASISIYPVLGITTGQLSIGNAEWSTSGPMMTADSLKVGVDLMGLMGGNIRITGIEAVRPVILLERARDGRVNWSSGTDGGAAGGDALALSLDRALIRNGSLRYVDHGGGTQEIENVDLDLRWPDYKGAATFDLVMRPNGRDVALSGKVLEMAALLAGKVSPLAVNVKTDGGTLAFDGRAGIAPEAAGKLALDLGDANAFLAALGVGASVPAEYAKGLKLNADTTYTADQQLSLRGAALTVGDYALAGEADIRLAGAKPRIVAKLATGALDLSGLTEDGEATAGWSDAPIDASALAAFDGEIGFSASSLKVAGLSFGATRVHLALDNSRAVFSLREVQGYSGVISGEFVANNRGGLSVGGALNAQAIELETLLGDLAGVTRLSGRSNGEIRFLGSGNSTAKIINSLSGSGGVRMGQGAIAGFDLQKLMSAEDGFSGSTGFDSLSASFAINGGVIANDDLLVTMPRLTATGKGRVDLGAQTIDYTFTPKALNARDGKGLMIPVRVRGPWAGPKITPDVEGAINLNFAEEKKKVEDKVKAKVEETVAKELGVTVQEGQSVEDAVKQEVQDQAVKGLLKLLK